MKKSNYFSERLERLLKGDIRRSKITQIRIKRGYKRAFQLIEDDIAKYVMKISAEDATLSANALKRKIPKEELLSRAKELKLEEETMANYENLSYAEAIRREMVKNVESMAKENESLIFENLFKTYEHNYYSTSYLLYRTMDDFSFTKRVTKEYFDWMAKKPWTSDGKTFSDRIWKDQKTLVDELYKEFTVSATRGANLKEAARRMSRKMDVSYKKCLRLLNTEDSFFSNKAVMDAYQSTTAEEYMILATLDRKTCEICGDQDTKHYMIKDAKVGVNMPPFHPNCRCTTVVYFGDEEDMPEERMMRDEDGKSVKTEYLSYDEWKKKYVDKTGEIGYNIGEDKDLLELIEQVNKVDIKDASKDDIINIGEMVNKKFKISEKIGNKEELTTIISKFREVGNYAKDDIFELGDVWDFDRSKIVKEQLCNAFSYYPKDWSMIPKNNNRKLFVRMSGRGYFAKGALHPNRSYSHSLGADKDGYLTIVTNGVKKTTPFHEIGHMVEWANPDVLRIEKEFIASRTVNEKPVKLKELFPNFSYSTKETTLKDDFICPYIGKEYEDATEVLSIGLEGLFEPSEGFLKCIENGNKIYKKITDDEEFLNLVIGLVLKG